MTEETQRKRLDPMMMQQYYMLQQHNKEEADVQKLKDEFKQFDKIKQLGEAREFAYKTYPKFKNNKSFVDSGVTYSIYDAEDTLRLLGWFPDEIICYEFV